jgi:purine-binding chemotaxis protein CheW
MDVQEANQALAAAASSEMQVLSFSLGSEEYAVDILRVREILGLRPLTPIPHAPQHVCGVMNLRGAVVPVLDMRASLSLAAVKHEQSSVIIVLTVCGRTMGFVVDGVSDVLTLDSGAIERAPELGGRIDAAKVRGIARTQDRYVILLDIDKVASLDLGPRP